MNSDNALLRPTIHLELRLNGLIEEAFLLTARGRQVIDNSLPLRDPIVILGYPLKTRHRPLHAWNRISDSARY